MYCWVVVMRSCPGSIRKGIPSHTVSGEQFGCWQPKAWARTHRHGIQRIHLLLVRPPLDLHLMAPVIDALTFLSNSTPWAHEASQDMIDDLVKAARANGRIIYLDGTRMTTVEALFREYVREFDLAEYLGWNWAAFTECMRNLSWISAESYLTIIRDSARCYCRANQAIGRRSFAR